jgi:preprotein translocase subunit SecE
MAKDQGADAPAARRPKGASRPTPPAKPGASAASARASAPAAPKVPFNPTQFAREVRAEARKISWTTWKETWITSVMVFIMVAVTSLFFFVVDIVLRALVQMLPQVDVLITYVSRLLGLAG